MSKKAHQAEVDLELTSEEKKAINALNRIAKNWPDSLWLFSASGTLWVMRHGQNGEQVHLGEGIDPNYALVSIRIPNDGGEG